MIGPGIEELTRRLVDTPADFLAPPRVAMSVGLDVAALVSDLLVDLGTAGLDSSAAAVFRTDDVPGARNWLQMVAVTTWLLRHPQLMTIATPVAAWTLLSAELRAMAGLVGAEDVVIDPDRREELARVTLAALGVVPAGETEAQAADRLSTLDSAERYRVLQATQLAELRAAEVRQAMHAKAAAEAAAKASRE